jgi:adenosylcobinamide-phosphate synthase
MKDFPWVHPQGRRDPGPRDIDGATAMLWRVWAVLLAGAALLTLAG